VDEGSGEDLRDRVVVVTGATRGIGRATALAFAREGCRVVVIGRSTNERPNRALPGTLEEVEAEVRTLGADVLPIAADVSVEDDARRIVDHTLDRFGRCDVLVNNAAVSFLGGFLDVPVSRWRAAVGVNLLGPVMLAHGFLPGMLARNDGSIVNVGSIAAHTEAGARSQLPYATTKYALERFTTGLAAQTETSGVTVNAIRIDEVVATEAVGLHMPELLRTAPLSADDFAPAIVWLCRARRTHGEILTIGALRSLGAFAS
jgi:NAD(P)-dependent dehydrogenase (short-subunit alcohol dehydrogenase family)